MTSLGTWAPETLDANSEKSCIALWSTKRHRRCSVVMPEGPPAAPRRDDLRFRQNWSWSKTNRLSGTNDVNSSGSGSRERVVWRGLSRRPVLLVCLGPLPLLQALALRLTTRPCTPASLLLQLSTLSCRLRFPRRRPTEALSSQSFLSSKRSIPLD